MLSHILNDNRGGMVMIATTSKWNFAAFGLMAGMFLSAPASASTFSDNLSKCLVDKSTESDKTALIQWVFSAISAGPAVKSMSTVTTAQRLEFNHAAAKLFVRLITVDCRAQTLEAIKFDGPSVLEAGFGTLGKVAMRGIMADPSVVAELDQLGEFMDAPALEKLGEEAGISLKEKK